jgi:uncharacterized delta-60 repeat protein
MPIDADQDGEDGAGLSDGDVACVSSGSPDPSFGNGGVTPFFGLNAGEASVATGVAIDSASRIVVVGGFTAGPRSCVIARFLPDGSRDGTFGMSGIVRQGIGEYACWFNKISLQADGKIVAFGEINGHAESRAVLARYMPDGTLDSSFGDNGLVLFDESAITAGLGVAVDSNQRIVVVGQSAMNGVVAFYTRRYLANGTLDTTFGESGLAEVAFMNGQDWASDVAIQTDGKIVVVGRAGTESSQIGIVRYNDDGTIDSSFGSMGIVNIEFDISSAANGVMLDSIGRSVVVGSTTMNGNDYRGVLTRLTTDGSVDSTLGGGAGKVASPLGLSYSSTAATVSQVSQNMILAVGSSTLTPSSSSIVLVRYTESGDLDSTFGTGGLAHDLPLVPWSQIGWDIAVQADARIVLVGGYGDLSRFDMFVARFCP